MSFEPNKTQPILPEEPVTQRQFYALSLRVSELSIRLDATERVQEQVESTRTQIEKSMITVDNSVDACREDTTYLEAKVDIYAFILVLLLGVVAWLK